MAEYTGTLSAGNQTNNGDFPVPVLVANTSQPANSTAGFANISQPLLIIGGIVAAIIVGAILAVITARIARSRA